MNIGTLPLSLEEAIEHFRESQLARIALGDYLYYKLIEHAESQCEDHRIRVTPWELETYINY